MSIKVTLGEAKPQNEKSFPKLMIGTDDSIIEVLKSPNEIGISPVVIRKIGSNQFGFTDIYVFDFTVINGSVKYTDYNEPITIQNA